MKMQDLYREYKRTAEEYDRLDQMLEADWENEELEAQVDRYYEETYYPAFRELVDEVKEKTNCGETIARFMIENPKFEELMNQYIVD